MHKRKSPSAKERLVGFKDALKKNSLNFDDEKIIFATDVSSESFGSKLEAFLTNQPATDGLFAINDFIALESLIVLRKKHKKIPDDLKIIGFDDIPQDRYSSPTLSSIKQDTEKIALKAAESLLNLIDNKADRGQSFVIPVTLVTRESTE